MRIPKLFNYNIKSQCSEQESPSARWVLRITFLLRKKVYEKSQVKLNCVFEAAVISVPNAKIMT